MTEPGWPLIPREGLPAPVQPAPGRAAPKGPRRVALTVPAGRQLSIWHPLRHGPHDSAGAPLHKVLRFRD